MMMPSRLDLSVLPRQKRKWFTPSIGRSSGTVAPTKLASVGNRLTPWTISSLSRAAGILPGQRIMNGARMPPSHAVKYWPRHGPAQPSHGLTNSGPLSLVKIPIVSSRIPRRSTPSIVARRRRLGQHVRPVAVPRLAHECGIGQRRQMRLRESDIGEEGLARLRLALHERDRTPRDLGVDQPALL